MQMATFECQLLRLARPDLHLHLHLCAAPSLPSLLSNLYSKFQEGLHNLANDRQAFGCCHGASSDNAFCR